MYFEIEPSGCCERNGMVQVRYSFYLDMEDEGYDKTLYTADGKEHSSPIHNHICLFDLSVEDEKIIDMGKGFMRCVAGNPKDGIDLRVNMLHESNKSSKKTSKVRLDEVKKLSGKKWR